MSVWIETRTQTAHGVLLDDVPLPPRLLQKNQIRHSPNETMPTKAMHARATPEPKQVLSPDSRWHAPQRRTLLIPNIIIQAANPQRKLQRKRTLDAAWCPHTRRILGNLMPTEICLRRTRSRIANQKLRRLARGLIYIKPVCLAFHSTAGAHSRCLLLNNPKLQAHVISQIFKTRKIISVRKTLANNLTTPTSQSTHSHLTVLEPVAP